MSGAEVGWPTTYDWRAAPNWTATILQGILEHGVRIVHRDIPQPYHRIVVFEVATPGGTHRVALDYDDTAAIDARAARDALLYFKLNHLERGYSETNVRPGGYVPARADLYRYLRLLRAVRGRPRFAWDVYGRFGLRYDSATRRRAYEILSARSDFVYEGSLFRYPGGPDKVPYRRYLFEITRAKVCVDMPNGGDLTFRLVDCLALGACVVRPRQTVLFPGPVRLHVPLVEGQHITHCEPDLSDLGDVCTRLVNDEAERERIANNARTYFDRYLHRRRLAAYYLYEIERATSD